MSFFVVPQTFAAAGINKQIHFQGKVVNTDGTNVTNGNYDFIFKIYSVDSGGAALWTESRTGGNQVTVTDGIFQVNLGSVTALPGSVDFNTDNIYLGIEFNSDGEMSPRVRFTAAPYAMNADKVHGLTVTDTTGTLTIPNGETISFGGSFTTTASNDLTLTTTAATDVTLPTTGTLATLAGSETLTNKTIGSTGLTFSGAVTDITTGTNESFVIVANGSGVVDIQDATTVDSLTTDTGGVSIAASQSYTGAGAVTLSSATASDLTLNSGTTGTIYIGTDASAEIINIGNTGAAVKTIAIGNNSQANTITIGDASATSVSITDNNWSVTTAGAASFTSLTSSGTIAFSGLSTNGVVYTSGGTGTLNVEAQLSASRGGTGLNTSSSTGVPTLSTGTWSVSSSLGVTLGGTGTTTQFTQGSIVFAGASGVYTQDNANFFFDDTNNYLGIGTAVPVSSLQVATGGLFSVTGTFGAGDTLPAGLTGAGTRMFFYPRKAAFRTGAASSTEWNDASIGNYSTVLGSGTASGAGSTAMSGGTASGADSIAIGVYSGASGDYSTAIGIFLTASGGNSTAMGVGTTSSGDVSTAMGLSTTAASYLDVALGRYNVGGGTADSWVSTDPLFEIGIGTSGVATANALTVLKNGNVGIGDATPSALLTVGSGDAFQVSSVGTVTIASGQSYTGAGAVTLSSATASDLTLNSGTTGTIYIGTDASAEIINIGNTGAAVKTIAIGNNSQANTITIGDASATSVSITDNNWSVTTAGVASFITGSTIGSQTFTTNNIADSGALTISSGATSALTLDSGTTGTITLGSDGSAETINIGTGVAAKTIVIGNASDDSFTLNSSGLNVSSGGALTGVASIDTIAVSATTITFAGTGTLASTTTGLTLDSGSGVVAIATGDYLALSHSGVSGAAAGYIWYDSSDNKFKVNENGATKILCNTTDAGCGTGGSADLQTTYGNDADGSNTTISLTAADDGLIITNPTSGGNDLSAFTMQVSQQHTTAAITALDIVQSSSGANAVDITANSIDTETGLSITANGLTSGKGLTVASSSTSFSGDLAGITLSGSNASNTGNVFSLANTGTANTNVTLFVDHRATGTNNLAVRVNDEASDTTPFVIDGTGKVGVGTTAPARAMDIFEAGSAAQLRLSKDLTYYSEMTVDSAGDLQISAIGTDIRALSENLWVCDNDACPALTLTGDGNIFIENVLKFGNGVYLKNDSATELGVYDNDNNAMLIFDEL